MLKIDLFFLYVSILGLVVHQPRDYEHVTTQGFARNRPHLGGGARQRERLYLFIQATQLFDAT